MATTKPHRPGVIILEGADASGKTTLARYLCMHYGARYLHNGPYRDCWRWHLGCFRRAERLALAGELVVVDRHWVSEMIYGNIYRGGAQYPVAARCLDRLWLRLGALNVLCVPSVAQAQIRRHTRLRAARDEYASDIRLVVDRYRQLAGYPAAMPGNQDSDYLGILKDPLLRRTDWHHYDLDQHGADLKHWCEQALELMPRWQPLRLLSTNYAGNHVAVSGHRALIVGERLSPQTNQRYAYPFIDREEHASPATYLNQALHYAEIDEGRLRWVDALDPDGAEAINLLLEVRDALRTGARVVCLGDIAADKIDRLTQDFIHLNHPHFEYRFNHQNPPRDYAGQLKEIFYA